MNHEAIRAYCLAKPYTTEGLPFDDTSLVFKVHGKMFAILSLDAQPPRINLKNDPEVNENLREEFETVLPGYHMNKVHWNTVIAEEPTDWELLTAWIDTSYKLIWQKLPKKLRVGS